MPKRSHLVLKMAEGPRPFRNPLCTWTPGMATFEGTRSPKCCPWTNQGHLTFQHTPPWPRPSPWDAYTRAYTNRGDPARLIRERPFLAPSLIMQDDATPADTPGRNRETPEGAAAAEAPERRVRPRETPVGKGAAAAPEPEEGASAEAQSEDSYDGDESTTRTTRRRATRSLRLVPRCGTGRFGGPARPSEPDGGRAIHSGTRIPKRRPPPEFLGRLPLTTTRLRTRGSGRSSKWRPDAWSTRRRSRASPPDAVATTE